MKSIFLVRIEWDENDYVRSTVILTNNETLNRACDHAIKKFKQGRAPTKCRVTWAEDITEKLLDEYGVTVYSYGPFGLHDPFCSSNRGKT